jgi:lysophospholipase L1-like esterase
MKKGWLFGGAVGALGLGIYLASTRPKRPDVALPTFSGTLWIIGDSQAAGITEIASPCGSIPNNPTCAKSGQVFSGTVPFGGTSAKVLAQIGGRTSDWTAAKLEALAISPGDTLVVFLGSNDYDGRPDPSVIQAFAKRRGTSLLWVGPPAIRGKIGTAPAFLAAALGGDYLDSRGLQIPLVDGIHPSPEGYKSWRTSVLNALHIF